MEVWKEIQVYLTALFLDCAVVPAPIKKRAAEAHRQRQGDGKMMGWVSSLKAEVSSSVL